MSARDDILERFNTLNVWSRGEQRAPHKPLLILYALARLSRGDSSDISFREVDRDLTELLKEFGPPRQSQHPEYPFWRLQNDGVWSVSASGRLTPRRSSTDPLKSDLLRHDAHGGFGEDVKKTLLSDPSLAREIATLLLDTHFPETLHSDILSAVGLDVGGTWTKRRPRDPEFRRRVLLAYEYRCAVCGLDIRLRSVSVALDAAHIRWHQADGPDIESNGLALCVLHHKLFDLGAFTLDGDGSVLVSVEAHGTAGFEDALLRHHARPVRPPQRPEWKPHQEFLAWHCREVFKGRARPQRDEA